MVLTVEVLVHRPDLGIFQAEDLFLITPESAQPLSSAGSELHVIA